jgi:hypothetical protein
MCESDSDAYHVFLCHDSRGVENSAPSIAGRAAFRRNTATNGTASRAPKEIYEKKRLFKTVPRFPARMRAGLDGQPSTRTGAIRDLYSKPMIWQHIFFFEFGHLDAT